MEKMLKRRRLLFEGASFPKFYIIQSGKSYEFYFEEGMSWNSFVQSGFNDGSFSLSGTTVLFKNGNVSGETSSKTIVAEKTYESLAKLAVFESGKRALSAGSIVTGSSKGYSFTGSAIKIGGSDAGRVSIQGIDFKNYSKLKFSAKATTSAEETTSSFYYVGYGTKPSAWSSSATQVMQAVPKTKTTLTFDIKNITEQKYIYMGIDVAGSPYIEVYDIWLE